eukprot:scaffold27758_cov112-Isochrysis_galbana.AAC.5
MRRHTKTKHPCMRRKPKQHKTCTHKSRAGCGSKNNNHNIGERASSRYSIAPMPTRAARLKTQRTTNRMQMPRRFGPKKGQGTSVTGHALVFGVGERFPSRPTTTTAAWTPERFSSVRSLCFANELRGLQVSIAPVETVPASAGAARDTTIANPPRAPHGSRAPMQYASNPK